METQTSGSPGWQLVLLPTEVALCPSLFRGGFKPATLVLSPFIADENYSLVMGQSLQGARSQRPGSIMLTSVILLQVPVIQ